MTPQPARFRFSLRSLLAIVFVVALLAAFPTLRRRLVWFVWGTGPLITLVAFLVVRNATRSKPPYQVARWPKVSCWLMLAMAGVPLIACWFIRYRWVNVLSDDRFPRPFPFPDSYLLQIHDWWDRLHPAPPGHLKLHGEYYSVLQGTNTLVLTGCVLFGAAAGVLFRDVDFLAASRRLTWCCRKRPPDTP